MAEAIAKPKRAKNFSINFLTSQTLHSTVKQKHHNTIKNANNITLNYETKTPKNLENLKLMRKLTNNI
jgi:hypothetical protein